MCQFVRIKSILVEMTKQIFNEISRLLGDYLSVLVEITHLNISLLVDVTNHFFHSHFWWRRQTFFFLNDWMWNITFNIFRGDVNLIYFKSLIFKWDEHNEIIKIVKYAADRYSYLGRKKYFCKWRWQKFYFKIYKGRQYWKVSIIYLLSIIKVPEDLQVLLEWLSNFDSSILGAKYYKLYIFKYNQFNQFFFFFK